MRRRSERKKSTDVSSPAPASRRSRRRKSPSLSESTDKNVDAAESTESQTDKETVETDGNEMRASSEERNETASARKARTSRTRTPAKERTSPAKRKNQRLQSIDQKIDTIPEEENNGSATNAEQDEAPQVLPSDEKEQEVSEPVASKVRTPSPELSPNAKVEEELKTSDVLEIQAEEQEDKDKDEDDQETTEMQQQKKESEEAHGGQEKLTYVQEEPEHVENSNVSSVENIAKEHSTDGEETRAQSPDKLKPESPPAVACNNDETKNTVPEPEKPTLNSKPTKVVDNGRTQRKRKWITKKTTESKTPVLAISTDSLKNLIADVHPVPLSDVQLESSSDIEEVVSEREEGEETPSPEREVRRVSTDKNEKSHAVKRNETGTTGQTNKAHISPVTQRPPSPARNQASNVLYITNLVRPFTVLQLKGLLARTGKIVEDGFWIDRIKSKCYVQYETEDEAIETRHALHGVRWPVSNPKCLNVDFGNKADMDHVIQSTKDDMPKFGQDNNKDNLIVGSGWSRERNDIDDKKNARPVREWDVGKKETHDRDKTREVDREKRRSKDRDISGNRENIRDDKDKDRDRVRDRKRRSRDRADVRSSSLSPSRKVKKKENDPPLRLLDDLFRKTKATPCIYWLPLTPEQIAEKEAFRQKRIEEHKERIKQRELERGKERDKERNRNNERARDRDRERDHKGSNRSSDRRSRSRDRRRY